VADAVLEVKKYDKNYADAKKANTTVESKAKKNGVK
jgi:hypothetical protein